MPTIIDMPPQLNFASPWAEPHLSYNTRSGGVSMSGDEQILTPLSSRWTWRLGVLIMSAADAYSFRKTRAALRGRFGYLRTKLPDSYRIMRADIGAVLPVNGVTFSSGVGFSDGSTFALSELSAQVAAAADAGATEIELLASPFGGAITAGVYFSINDWFYHLEDWEADGGNYRVTITPPLREAISTSDEADFSGRAIWQLAEDMSGDLDLDHGGLYGIAELRLVEPVGRRLSAA